MSFTLRPWRKPDEYARLAELINQVDPEPVTAEKIAEWEGMKSPEAIRLSLVAADEHDRMIAWGDAIREPWMSPGKFWLYVVTDKAHRNQGAGAALAAAVEAFAREHGATLLVAETRDDNEAARAFVEKRGYTLDRHRFESTLQLDSFDDARFAGVVDGARSTGIRFTTLAAEPGEAMERQVYATMRATAFDIPGWDDGYPPFEEWRKWALESADMPWDCFILALDGDRVVGLTCMEHVKATGALYTAYTGVSSEYRGRNIALALKLLAVETARRYGAPYMRTNNDSKNAPMLAVNRKMGYVPSPGLFKFEKRP